jgi:hypothetical protein
LISGSDDGIVVVRGREQDNHMEIEAVPLALRGRLGSDATAGLLDVLEHSHSESREAVISACTERFERRLVEEVSELRVQIAQATGGIKEDIAERSAHLFKWCFLFWVGQVIAVSGIVGVMMRLSR